jgi:hypothetical protein
MTKLIIPGLLGLLLTASNSFAQKVKAADVPGAVKSALAQKYPDATGVTWEKEKGNYEANWGGKSQEDNSVVFTPAGSFVEVVRAISVADLPVTIAAYVKKNYPGAKITEAGKVTNAKGKITYEAEVKGKDLIFDENGNYIKAGKD